MGDPTEEDITQVLYKESTHISATLASISRTTHVTTSTGPNPDINDINLSGLVELRAAHETLRAQGCTRSSTRAIRTTGAPHSIESPSEALKKAWKEIVERFHQLLRDAGPEGERVGTGLHRTHIWAGESGNALNAAKAAESRTNKACDHIIIKPIIEWC